MAEQFQGFQSFVRALTGENQFLDRRADEASFSRLLRQRSAQTSLDRQLELLARDRDINLSRGDLRGSIDDDVIRALTLGGPGVGANFSAAQTGVGTGIKNTASQTALDAVLGAETAGADPRTDFINALIGVAGNRQTSPSGVLTREQATSDLRGSEAVAALNEGRLEDLLPTQVGAAEALTNQRNRAGGGLDAGPDLEPLTSIQAESLILDPESIPITSGIPFFKKTENVPFDDPRAQEKFSELSPSKQSALLQFLGPEFAQWRIANLPLDPTLADSDIAIGKFLEFKRSGSAAPVAGAGPAPVTQFIRDTSGNLVVRP